MIVLFQNVHCISESTEIRSWIKLNYMIKC